MAMIDEQHADMKSLISRISVERLEYSAAYEKCVAPFQPKGIAGRSSRGGAYMKCVFF